MKLKRAVPEMTQSANPVKKDRFGVGLIIYATGKNFGCL